MNYLLMIGDTYALFESRQNFVLSHEDKDMEDLNINLEFEDITSFKKENLAKVPSMLLL